MPVSLHVSHRCKICDNSRYGSILNISVWCKSRLGKGNINPSNFVEPESNQISEIHFRRTLKVKRLSSDLDEVLRRWRQHQKSGERWATVLPSRDGVPVFYGKVEQEEPASCLKVSRWFYQDSQLYCTVHNSYAVHVSWMNALQKVPFKSGSRGRAPFAALLFGLCQRSQSTFHSFNASVSMKSAPWSAFWMRYRRACCVSSLATPWHLPWCERCIEEKLLERRVAQDCYWEAFQRSDVPRSFVKKR